MNQIIAAILPHAVSVALSPLPLAALILILLSTKARINSVMYLFGWVTAIILNVGIFTFILTQDPSASGKSLISSIVDALLGIFLLILAIKQWRMRPKSDEKPPIPKWMSAVESFSPMKSFLSAFVLVTINAKNTILDISAGVLIGQLSKNLSEALLSLLIYTIIASSSIAFLVILFFILGDKLNPSLNKLKIWFISNNATILFVMFLILGVSLLSKAIGGM